MDANNFLWLGEPIAVAEVSFFPSKFPLMILGKEMRSRRGIPHSLSLSHLLLPLISKWMDSQLIIIAKNSLGRERQKEKEEQQNVLRDKFIEKNSLDQT